MDQNTIGFINQDNSDIEGSSILAARSHYSKGNYDEALNLLLSISHTSIDSTVCVEIGNCYYMQNKPKEALEHWEKAIKLDSKNAKAYTNLGNLYYKRNQVEMAISLWLVALIIRPEDAQTALNLAVAFDKKSMRFEAIKYFEKYIKYEENKTAKEYLDVKNKIQECFNIASQYLTLGVQCQSNGDNKQAAACYFKSLANYPNLSKTNLNLGSIFFEDKNLELAVKYWKTALYIDPTYDKIYSNLAISYDMMQKFDYAYCYYYQYMNFIIHKKDEYMKVNQRFLKIKQYLSKHSELIQIHLGMAQEHLAKNEIYEAIDEYRNHSILNPNDKTECKEKIHNLESYLNPEANVILSCFEAGNKLLSRGKPSEAKHYFWRIMTLSSPQLLEYSKARAKYSQCEKSQVGMDEC